MPCPSRLVAGVVLLALAPLAHGWNGPGHQTIDLVAWNLLDDDDRARATALLRDHPRFEQHFLEWMPPAVWKGSPAEQNQWCFAHAGTWPDQVRSTAASVTREDVREFNQPKWHYINLPVGLKPAWISASRRMDYDTKPPKNLADPDQNIVQAINGSLAVLADDGRPRAERAVALAWLLHLAGDSHQPMHASALFTEQRFPNGDRGGNAIPVRGAEGDLHGLWDASILPGRTDYNRVRREALELVDQHADAGKVAAGQLLAAGWIRESWEIAETQAYSKEIRDAVRRAERGGDLDRIELSPDYLKAAGLTSKRRAADAGFRIAAILKGRLPAAEGVPAPLPKPRLSAMEKAPASSVAPAATTTAERYWLNTKTGVRHNASCRNFEKTSAGRHCSVDEGKACGICGG